MKKKLMHIFCLSLILAAQAILAPVTSEATNTTETRNDCSSGCLPVGNGIYTQLQPIVYTGCRGAMWYELADGCTETIFAECGTWMFYLSPRCPRALPSGTGTTPCTSAKNVPSNIPCARAGAHPHN